MTAGWQAPAVNLSCHDALAAEHPKEALLLLRKHTLLLLFNTKTLLLPLESKRAPLFNNQTLPLFEKGAALAQKQAIAFAH